GLAINSASPARVVLRNLAINGLGGVQGVQVTKPAEVHIYDCAISSLPMGIEITATGGGSALYVRDTLIRGGGTAVHVGGNSTFEIDNARLLENTAGGIRVDAGGLGAIRRSTISSSGGSGVVVNSDAALSGAALTIEDSLIDDNVGDGVTAT